MIDKIEELDIETFPIEDSGAQLLTMLAHINGTKRKINELVDAVNELKESQYIYKKSSITRAKNVQSDVKTRPVTVSELAYLQKENSDLKDELERTRKALEVAVDALKSIGASYPRITDIAMQDKANTALEQITALEQRDN